MIEREKMELLVARNLLGRFTSIGDLLELLADAVLTAFDPKNWANDERFPLALSTGMHGDGSRWWYASAPWLPRGEDDYEQHLLMDAKTPRHALQKLSGALAAHLCEEHERLVEAYGDHGEDFPPESWQAESMRLRTALGLLVGGKQVPALIPEEVPE